MKNVSKIPLKIVIQTIPRIQYLKYLKLLGQHGFRQWASDNHFNWQSDYSAVKFIEWLDKQNRLQDFYKDVMNEISSEINPESITEED